MKDEELAEEYADKTFDLYCPTDQERYQVEQAFLAGFRACAKKRLNATTISDCPIKDNRLTKAKEIIKQLMYASRDCIAWYCLCDKAKQFLKEIDE